MNKIVFYFANNRRSRVRLADGWSLQMLAPGRTQEGVWVQITADALSRYAPLKCLLLDNRAAAEAAPQGEPSPTSI